jgi:hypothetical protein|tara:strand:+ start:132 stop:362 length:231 start_codon:yes stop_codon:yes gene_type:complete
MVKRHGVKLLNLITWVTGVVVSLVVGAAMTGGSPTLTLPTWLGGATAAGLLFTNLVGWVVIITTLVGAVMAIQEII